MLLWGNSTYYSFSIFSVIRRWNEMSCLKFLFPPFPYSRTIIYHPNFPSSRSDLPNRSLCTANCSLFCLQLTARRLFQLNMVLFLFLFFSIFLRRDTRKGWLQCTRMTWHFPHIISKNGICIVWGWRWRGVEKWSRNILVVLQVSFSAYSEYITCSADSVS